jgi:hypothetical protein
MKTSDDHTKTPHAAGSQPSTRPGSDEPQTITAPTPPVARDSGPPDQADLADGGGTQEPPEHDEQPPTASHDD